MAWKLTKVHNLNHWLIFHTDPGGRGGRPKLALALPTIPLVRENARSSSSNFLAAVNYATSLERLKHHNEAKALMLRTIPVARRVFGESHELTIKMRWCYTAALCNDPGATLNDIREALTTLEDIERIARRVLGDAHPLTKWIEDGLQDAQDVLYARGLP